MRAVLVVLILAVLVVIAAIASGFIDISQTRDAQAPDMSATHNGVVAKGGQTPAFDVQTGSVEVGSRNATVQVPDVRVVPPGNQAATQNSQNSVNAN